jgi:hypothetical protein
VCANASRRFPQTSLDAGDKSPSSDSRRTRAQLSAAREDERNAIVRDEEAPQEE